MFNIPIDINTRTVSPNTEVIAGTALAITDGIQKVYGTGGVTLTATPSIADTASDRLVTILGTSDINTVTFQDESNLAGSGLELSGGIDITLGLYDTLKLMYDIDLDKWIEISRSIN